MSFYHPSFSFLSRVISRAPGLKLVVETLISSLKPIGNIVLICCAFFIIFGILGVQVGRYCPSNSSPLEPPIATGTCTPRSYNRHRKESRAGETGKPVNFLYLPSSTSHLHNDTAFRSTDECSASAGIAGRERQELTLTPGSSWVRVWVSVIGRAQGWHSTGLTGPVHVTPQGQAAQCLLT